MRSIPALLAALLPACHLTELNSGGDCPGPYDASDAYDIDAAVFDEVAGSDDTLSEEECATLCTEVGGPFWMEIDACTFTDSEPGGDTGAAAIVGTVQCSGSWQDACLGGRAPGSLRRIAAVGRGRGRWLGQMATMEAVSITAFVELANDLQRLGAPAGLVRGARRAALDEVRHCRVLSALAKQAGGRPARAIRAHRPALDLGAFATPANLSAFAAPANLSAFAAPANLSAFAAHNASAGCVAETWSALVARHQGLHAPTAALRTTFGAIAADEAVHADLAWRIHRWALRAGADTTVVQQAVRRAAAGVVRTAGTHTPAGLGLPGPRQARQLAAGLDRALWSAV